MNSELSQLEADALLALEKVSGDQKIVKFAEPGGKISASIHSVDGKEAFFLDVNRASISLAKITYQTRARQIVVLARLDLGGAPHRNPDGTEIGVPHLHLYREGFDDKWAFDLPLSRFQNLADKVQSLEDFMQFCNIIDPPRFEWGLF